MNKKKIKTRLWLTLLLSMPLSLFSQNAAHVSFVNAGKMYVADQSTTGIYILGVKRTPYKESSNQIFERSNNSDIQSPFAGERPIFRAVDPDDEGDVFNQNPGGIDDPGNVNDNNTPVSDGLLFLIGFSIIYAILRRRIATTQIK